MLDINININKKTWSQLRSRWDRLPHALLLHGPAGIGKGDFATGLAAALLCERPGREGFACGHCEACVWFSLGNHPDYRCLQPAALGAEAESAESVKKKPSREITIDQIRDLDAFLTLGAHRQGRRVVVINPAEAMNRNTANALLKSLEEPGNDLLFLLVTHRFEQLLPTIRSRCQHLPFHIPPKEDALDWLKASGVQSETARWLAVAGGAPLAAAALASSDGLRTLIGTLERHLDAGAALVPVTAAAELEKQVKAIPTREFLHPLRVLIEVIQRRCADLTQVRAGLPPRYDVDNRSRLQVLSSATSMQALLRFMRALNRHKVLAEHSLNQRLYLEEILMHYRATFAGGTNDGR